MSDLQFTSPVVFFIFNRPANTATVFDVIRQVKPSKLFVIADSARPDRVGEAEKCAAARAVIETIDWDCEVFKDYSDHNLGCAKRISSGLHWVFEQVDEAIILEDDCVPHPTFFRFCAELLERYRHDPRIAVISGQNMQFGQKRTEYSYYFSRYNHCWGWATWKRAWQNFDFDMKLWPEVKEKSFLIDILGDSQAVEFWSDMFQSTYEGKINSWAYRWTLSCWLQGTLSILSNVNLISNVGFGPDGTNITQAKGQFASRYNNMPTEAIEFPIKHPPYMIRDDRADRFTQRTLFKPRLKTRLKHRIKRLLNQ
jgi:hypothetical protein